MTPGGSAPSDTMLQVITTNFGSLDNLQEQFNASAAANFGSGRTWVIKDHDELKIVNTANQNNPLMDHQKAILGIDVREHAYYLKYQNRRADYLNSRWKVVNWAKVEELYNK